MTQLLAAGNNPAPYARASSIVDAFGEVARRTPSAVAVTADTATLTYHELDARSNRLAHHLIALGVMPGSMVGVAFERSVHLPEALLAILKAGAAYVALDASYPAERLERTIRDAAIEWTLAASGITAAALPAGSKVIDVVADAPLIERSSSAPPRVATGPEDLAYVAYTSGSTGRAKGVMIPHRGVVRLVRGTDYFDARADDVFLHFAPLGFDASTFEIWAPLLNGARLAIAPPGHASFSDLGRVLERHTVTVLWLTASLFRSMVASRLTSFAGLRHVLTGGDVVSVEAATAFLDAFPECTLTDGYGPTENTTFSCCYRIPSVAAIRSGVPIGTAIAHSTAYIVDERFAIVPAGATGELCVGGDGLARGYLNLPEATAERFVRDPFSADPQARLYRTGDRARVRADGAIEFLGRIDHQVKIRGYRVELEEIEGALRGVRGIAEAGVSAVAAGDDRILVAQVAGDARTSLDSARLRATLARTLPPHMVPAHIVVADRLPSFPSGKLDRVRLAERAASIVGSGRVNASPPRFSASSTQQTIVACWSEALGASGPLDLDENFFDAGGDSLRLLRLHDRLVRTLGIDVPVVDLFEHCTIRRLATYLDAIAKSQTPISVD